jgi:hypothetical protein
MIILSGGGIAVFKIQQVIHQRHVLETIHLRTSLKKITLSTSVFKQALLNKNEICLQGEMYDIQRIVTRGNQVDLFLIKDSYEDTIIHKMSAFSEDDHSNDFPPTLFQLLVLDYVLPVPYTIHLIFERDQFLYMHYEEHLLPFPFSKIDQPPKATVQNNIA